MGPRPLRFHGTLLARLLALAAEHDVPYRPIQANQADVPRASVPAVPTNAKCPLVPSRAHQSGRRPGPVRFFPFACAHRMLHGALFKRACCLRPVSSAEARDPVSPLPHVDRRHADPLLRRQIRALSPRQPRPAKTVIQEYSAYSAGGCVGVLGLRAETFAPYTAAAASAKANGASERAHVCRRAASRLCSDGGRALLWFALVCADAAAVCVWRVAWRSVVRRERCALPVARAELPRALRHHRRVARIRCDGLVWTSSSNSYP